MKNEENEVNVLDELNKGACMGMDAIHYTLDKVSDNSLEKELKRQYKEYKKISDEIKRLYPEYNEDNSKPHETNALNKAMTWYGIEMKTMIDDSSSHIAELILQGTNMGIIEGRKLLNNKDVDSEVKTLIEEYVSMQEHAVEVLKQFL